MTRIPAQNERTRDKLVVILIPPPRSVSGGYELRAWTKGRAGETLASAADRDGLLYFARRRGWRVVNNPELNHQPKRRKQG